MAETGLTCIPRGICISDRSYAGKVCDGGRVKSVPTLNCEPKAEVQWLDGKDSFVNSSDLDARRCEGPQFFNQREFEAA